MPLALVERPPLGPGPARGALVVLVHGSMDRASSFRRVIARLDSLGGDVVLAAAQRRPDLIDTAVVFEPPQPWHFATLIRRALERRGGRLLPENDKEAAR